MRGNFYFLITFCGLLCGVSPLFAWSEHALAMYPALRALPSIGSAPAVKVESLEDFLRAEEAGLVRLLEREEAWARGNVATYPPLPEANVFEARPDDAAGIRGRFLRALRVHPELRLQLYVQMLPGEDCVARARMDYRKISVFSEQDAFSLRRIRFCALQAGESVQPLAVVASASDEPDYGHDINLWEDSPAEFGAQLGFGKQPFGNPTLYYATQAPFHMGFYHEAGILYLMAGFLRRTYPEYRAHQYASLARFAFETGHDYWGYRFMGWGLHYISDLTQPYHSTVVPGLSTAYMLWINLLDILGFPERKTHAIQLVSNRHTALEEFQMQMMHRAYREGSAAGHPVFTALEQVDRDAAVGQYSDAYIREVIAAESYERAADVDAALTAYVPARFVGDPDFYFPNEERDRVYDVVRQNRKDAVDRLNETLVALFERFGVHSRNYARSILRK
jgi:hypothetical protein